MPQWGMGKGLQNVVNSWVNVNNNHVVFPGEEDEGNLHDGTVRNPGMNSQSAFESDQHRSFMTGAQSTRRIDGSARRDISDRNGTVLRSPDRSSYPYSSMRQTQQKTRKLKKTNSQSDLLKVRAARRGVDRKDIPVPVTSAVGVGTATMNHRDRRSSAASISSDRSSQKLPVNTGQYVNEMAFVNQHKQLAAQQTDNSSKGKKLRPAKQPAEEPSNQGPRRSSVPENMRYVTNNSSPLPSVTSMNGSSTASKLQSREPSVAGKDNSACNQCELDKKQILALEADLEYIRSAALNSEYVCLSCEKRVNGLPMNSASSVASGRSVKSNRSRQSKSSSRMVDSSAHSIGTRSRKSTRQIDVPSFNENIALAESSQRLIDANSRHKRQIEQVSREMVRWKNEMHLKLSKLAMMCQDLNDESAKRKEQVQIAKQDLGGVRDERNTLSSELEILRARVILYEKQEAENTEIRRLLRENENETLAMADQAISERDAVIEDLKTRLVQSMDLLDRERDQLNQIPAGRR